MKALVTFFLILLSAGAWTQTMSCDVPERLGSIPSPEKLAQVPDGVLCSSVLVQVDYGIVEHFGLQGAKDYIDGLMAEAAIPFANIDIELSFDYDYLLEPTYTPGNSYDMLLQFQQRTPFFTQDVAKLLYLNSSGGIAWVNTACKDESSFKYSFSNISTTYKNHPEYSFSSHVIPHELGHNYGSRHTHDAVWNGNNTPIDGCGGGDGPIPDPQSANIMSYCHLSANGMTLDHGFGPVDGQVAQVIRYGVYSRCTTCDTPPDDDDPDPPIITCDGNTVFLDLILDAYPDETSYYVTDAVGNLVHESEPFNRSQVGDVISDTLCLPDGCYTYTIKDSTGLASVPCLDGFWFIGDPFGEFGSGQDFAGMVDVRFCVGNPVEPKCEDVGLDSDSLVSFANQDQVGGVSVAGEGLIKLFGNTWKAQPYEYVVTENTVLTGRVQVQALGEIHGFSVVKNTRGLSLRNTIQFGGTQPWGVFYEVEGIESGNWVDVEIPIGQLIPPDTYSYVVLINDHDVPNPTAKTGFREFEMCEEPGQQLKRAIEVKGELQDESLTQFSVIVEDIILRPYPNPVTDTLNLDYDVFWELYGPAGVNIGNGYGRHVSFTGLPIGFYTLRVGNKAYKVVKN